MAKIIIFPNSNEYKDELKRLRSELGDLIIQRDNLIYHDCEKIRAAYIKKFAAKEYKNLRLALKYQKLYRKVEILQAKINRQEEISFEFLDQIDKALDEELKKYWEELENKFDQINWATDYLSSDKMTGQEYFDFKRKYKELVKRLHPDLNPDLSDQLLEIFYKIVDAYKNGWNEIINIYYELIIIDENMDIDGIKNFKEEIERLKLKIEKIKSSIEQIKTSYPYSYKDIIENPDRVEDYHKKLNELIASYKSSIEYLENRLKELKKNVRY